MFYIDFTRYTKRFENKETRAHGKRELYDTFIKPALEDNRGGQPHLHAARENAESANPSIQFYVGSNGTLKEFDRVSLAGENVISFGCHADCDIQFEMSGGDAVHGFLVYVAETDQWLVLDLWSGTGTKVTCRIRNC